MDDIAAHIGERHEREIAWNDHAEEPQSEKSERYGRYGERYRISLALRVGVDEETDEQASEWDAPEKRMVCERVYDVQRQERDPCARHPAYRTAPSGEAFDGASYSGYRKRETYESDEDEQHHSIIEALQHVVAEIRAEPAVDVRECVVETWMGYVHAVPFRDGESGKRLFRRMLLHRRMFPVCFSHMSFFRALPFSPRTVPVAIARRMEYHIYALRIAEARGRQI